MVVDVTAEAKALVSLISTPAYKLCLTQHSRNGYSFLHVLCSARSRKIPGVRSTNPVFSPWNEENVQISVPNELMKLWTVTYTLFDWSFCVKTDPHFRVQVFSGTGPRRSVHILHVTYHCSSFWIKNDRAVTMSRQWRGNVWWKGRGGYFEGKLQTNV